MLGSGGDDASSVVLLRPEVRVSAEEPTVSWFVAWNRVYDLFSRDAGASGEDAGWSGVVGWTNLWRRASR